MAGLLVLADVHGMNKPFSEAILYAQKNDLTVLTLGDLCDQNDGSPEIFSLMRYEIEFRNGLSIMGNHEHKNFRYLNGNDVVIKPGSNDITIKQFKENPQFIEDFLFVCDNSDTIINWKTNVFVHGSVPPIWWTNPNLSNKQKNICMYGEAKGPPILINGRKIPGRTYNWVDSIPPGFCVYIGHDIQRDENNVIYPAPTVHYNSQLGSVTFLDCGAGKGGTHLWGVVFDEEGNRVDFVSFKI